MTAMGEVELFIDQFLILAPNRCEKSPSRPGRVTTPSAGPQAAGDLACIDESFATVGNRRIFGSAARDYVDWAIPCDKIVLFNFTHLDRRGQNTMSEPNDLSTSARRETVRSRFALHQLHPGHYSSMMHGDIGTARKQTATGLLW